MGIRRKKKICKCGCGQEGYIWAKGMLRHCYLRSNPQKPLQRSTIKTVRQATGEGALFQTIINTRRPVSFLSGLNILDIDKKIDRHNCHHVLPKKDYEAFRLYDRNIILIIREEHDLIHYGTHESREKYAKRILEEYGLIVHWEKLEQLKNDLLKEYNEIN